MKWFKKKDQERRELQYINCNNVGGGGLPFFPFQNQSSALNLSAVYRAVDLISNSIASLPIKVLINGQQRKE